MLEHFLIAAAILLVVVLVLLLRPLLRRQMASETATSASANLVIFRNQLMELERDHQTGNLSDSDFAQAQAELQQRILCEVPVNADVPATGRRVTAKAVVLAFTVVLASAFLYLMLGTPAALLPGAYEATPSSGGDANQVVNDLSAQLRQHPDDPDAWALLAKAYKDLQQYDKADEAFSHIGPIMNTNADMLAEHADLLAAESHGQLEGQVRTEFEKALSLNPNQSIALMLAGTAAYQKQNYAQAVVYWKRLQKQIPPGSENAHVLRDAIALAENNGKSILSAQKITGKTVSGQVSLSPDLADNVAATDTVFIYAQAIDGPRVPLAVLREHISDLPVDFTLDDSQAMTPELTLSKASRVRVIARVSKSGDASPQAGDLIGESGPVVPGVANLSIVIKTVFQP